MPAEIGPTANPSDQSVLEAKVFTISDQVADRTSLKRKLFALWDQDRDGALKKPELLKLARATGFDGTEEEWNTEYPEMCAEKGCSTETGLSEEAVMTLFDDDSDNGCYLSNEDLKEILSEAGALTEATEAAKPDVRPSERQEDTNMAVEPTLDREALKRRLFRLWDQDKDGALKEDEMMQVALATGFDGSDEDWHKEYAAMCEEHGCKPEAGFSKAAVLALLDDESENGAHLPTEEIERIAEVLGGGERDPEEEIEYKLKVVRDAEGKAGFNVRQVDMVVTGLLRPKELHPMQNGDVVLAVNDKAIEVFADYTKLAHGVKEFTLTLKKPKEFQDAETWRGVKPGYVFKLGDYGIGYYRDVKMGVHAVMTGVEEFHSSKRFTGEWPGYVFKMGHLGLGYYLDLVSRSYLKKRLFELWDQDKDGRLNRHEACNFARDTGFTGTYDEFLQEYQQMCSVRSCDPEQGLTATAVSDMLEDKTDRGCFLTGNHIEELITKIENTYKLKERSSKSTTVPLAELPPARLKALAKLHSVSLTGCLEKSEMVDALRKAGVPDQGAAAVAAAAEKILGDGDAASKERGTFVKKVSMCDESGSLKKDSVIKMAQCVGWIGTEESWVQKFSEVFRDHGGNPKEDLSIATVMALAEATKAELLEKGVGAADLGEDGQPLKKKAKVMPPPEKKKVERRCEACEKEPPDTAAIFCSNCKAFLCTKCDEDNHATKLLKKHKRVNCDGSGPVLYFKSFTSMSVGDLKALAKKHGTDLSGCVEKKDLIAALEKAGVKPPEESAAEAPKAAPAQAPKGTTNGATEATKVVEPPKKEEKKEGDIRPPPKTKETKEVEASRLQELYVEHRARMGPGSQWELQTGVALWRNDVGWERTHYLMPKTASGWPTVIEVLEYGANRLKVRGMGVDRGTGTLVGLRWQMGWLELAMIVDKDSGELLVQPSTQTGQFFKPVPKSTGQKVMPSKVDKEKEAATADPEAGALKPEGMTKEDVFKKEGGADF